LLIQSVRMKLAIAVGNTVGNGWLEWLMAPL